MVIGSAVWFLSIFKIHYHASQKTENLKIGNLSRARIGSFKARLSFSLKLSRTNSSLLRPNKQPFSILHRPPPLFTYTNYCLLINLCNRKNLPIRSQLAKFCGGSTAGASRYPRLETEPSLRHVLSWSRRLHLRSKLTGFQNRFRLRWNARALLRLHAGNFGVHNYYHAKRSRKLCRT